MGHRHEYVMCFLTLVLLIVIPGGVTASQAQGINADSTGMKSGSSQAVSKPSIVYVADFYLDPDQITKQAVIKRDGFVKKRLDKIKNDDDPADKAAKLISTLSDAIVSGLQTAGQKAERSPGEEGFRKDFMPDNLDLPKDGWLVTGWFSNVDEGNRALSSSVGFGKGSASVQLEVVVYDLSNKAGEPFLHIGSDSGAKKTPGGLITKNPYSIAAKYVLSKGATEKDVQKQGSEIAKGLLQYINDHAPK
jgi:hypothetical protein